MTQGAAVGTAGSEASAEDSLDTPAASRGSGPTDAPGCGPPRWLRFVALASAAGVMAFGSVGLLLAINGWYEPALAFPIGAVAWLAVLILARPAFAPASGVAAPKTS